ncbi:MAG TPA: hypothetical protein VMT88_00355 [Actinomycetes bacterium]|nr:hypothetical protein [Actinomycetes bacterium]
MRRASVSAVVGVVAMSQAIAGCGGPTLVPITGYQVDGPDLKVAFVAVDCAESYSAEVTAETDTDVTLEVSLTGAADACQGTGNEEFAVVDLTAVLGNRTVIDGSTGNPVPTSK